MIVDYIKVVRVIMFIYLILELAIYIDKKRGRRW